MNAQLHKKLSFSAIEYRCRFACLLLFTSLLASPALTAETSMDDLKSELAELRQIVIAQQAQIDHLTKALEDQQATAAPDPANATPATEKPIQALIPKSKKEGFSTKLYGFIKLDASYDTQKTAVGDLAFYVLPESADGSDNEFNLTAKESRLGLKINSGDELPIKTSGTIEFDFYGSSSEIAANPRMRHAFFQFEAGDWDILAGQTWDATQSILPKTLNFATYGRQGATWTRRPQIRATRTLDTEQGKWTFAGALARTTGADLDGLGQEDGKDFAIPTVQGRLAYEFDMDGRKVLLALAGHYGTETVDSALFNDVQDYHSEFLSASILLPIGDKLDLKTVVWTGENLSCINGGIGQGINLTKNTEIAATGGWIQIGYTPNEKVKSFLTYGIDDPKDADLNAGQRSKNQTLSASIWWNFADHLTWAFEYSRMKTDYLDMDDASNNRFQSALILVF